MAYETAQFSSTADLFTKLSTFAVANGWTEDHSASDRMFLTRGTVSVAFRWDSGSPGNVGIYQHLSFINSGTDPGNHTDDSGNGNITGTNANLDDQRFVNVNNAGGTYWFFESDTYIHVVVENNTQKFHHFGFGTLVKLGTWTGGEYAYGSRSTVSGTGNGATNTSDSFLLDGLTEGAANDLYCATLHAESLPNQDASGKWGIVWAGNNSDTGTDRGGTDRANCQGGYRGGPVARQFARFGGTPQNGLVPLYPINLYYDDPSNARWYPLGYMPDVRGFYIEHYVGGDEITVGSDTWVVFPIRFKTSTQSNGSSKYAGVAYKKVTT